MIEVFVAVFAIVIAGITTRISIRVGFYKPSLKNLGALKNFAFGVLSWFVCYPVVYSVNILLGIIVRQIFDSYEIEQLAVREIKSTFNDPSKFMLAAVNVVIIAPIFEELLFRRVIQRIFGWAGFPVSIAIVLTSMLFATFHYSSSQGIYNLELLPSLFVLSCYLGYIYYRQHSIWAPIGLHATFNLVNLTLILAQSALVKAA